MTKEAEVKPTKEEVAAEKAAKAAAKQAEKDAAKAAKEAEKAAKPAKIEKNGVVRPKDDSETGKVWSVCDALSAKLARVPAREEVLKAAGAEGVNAATTSTQYARWRKFHGVTGTVANPNKVVKEKPVKAEKPAKAEKAEKAAK